MTSTPRASQPDEKDLGPDDSISMVSTSTVNGHQADANLQTPTSSSISSSNCSDNIPYITRNSAPGPDYTYIIVDMSGGDNKALTVVGGHLRQATPFELLPIPPVLYWTQAKAFVGACNWHWHCEESDGWLGFRNAATGRWLGSHVHNKTWDSVFIKARATEFGVTEQFCVRKENDDEGYALLKRVDLKRGVCLMPVGSNVDGCITFLHAGTMQLHKTTWEFVKVDIGVVSGTTTDGDSGD